MPSIINSDDGVVSGTSGLKTTGGNDGLLNIQTNGSTAMSINASQQVTFNNGANLPNTFGFKNRVINGAMAIDQRNAGSSFTVPNANGYGSCDRWASLAGATSTWTMQRVATADSDFPNALRVGRNAGSTSTSAIYVGQVIETNNCQDLAGQSVAFSFFADAGANFSASGGNLTCEVWTGSGTDQGWQSLNSATWTTQALAASNNATLTTTRQRFTYSLSIAAGTKEIAVRFSYAGVGTAGANDWFEVTGVQLEKGSTATSFDYRPYGTELALCQRYFCKSYNVDVVAGTVTQVGESQTVSAGGVGYLQFFFPVTMRATPTMTYFGPRSGGSGVFNTAQTTATASVAQSYVGQTTAWGAASVGGASYVEGHFTASIEL